ncbi:hypothetical protein [Desmospora activa]|uniref:hypothetical protein n=1 Tax=Desmospora activa TaxID=500615 RepID=UPI000D2FC9CA|nr:hypothetical protein [Desmospora activa]
MVHAVGFDLDETLLHRSASLLRFIRWQHGQHPLIRRSISLQDWCERFIDWDRGGYVSKEVVYTKLINHFSLGGKGASRYQWEGEDRKPIPGMIAP